MSAKRLLIISGCVLICFLFAGFTCHWLRVQYHLHALRKAQSEIESAQKEQDCILQSQALVKLGYFEEKVLVMEHRMITGTEREAFTSFVSERMPKNVVYSFGVSSKGRHVIFRGQKMQASRFWSVLNDYDNYHAP